MDTLADVLAREGGIDKLDAVGWTIRLTKRLQFMHTLGMAHGSLSTMAVLVEGAKPTHKGLLRNARLATDVPAYRSPERPATAPGSPADDTWAVGVFLYTLLTGKVPFAGDDYEEVQWKILAGPPPPLASAGVVEPLLQGVLDRLFVLDVSKRISGVVALRQELEAWRPALGELPWLELEPLDPSVQPEREDDKTKIKHDVDPLVRQAAERTTRGSAPDMARVALVRPAAGAAPQHEVPTRPPPPDSPSRMPSSPSVAPRRSAPAAARGLAGLARGMPGSRPPRASEPTPIPRPPPPPRPIVDAPLPASVPPGPSSEKPGLEIDDMDSSDGEATLIAPQHAFSSRPPSGVVPGAAAGRAQIAARPGSSASAPPARLASAPPGARTSGFPKPDLAAVSMIAESTSDSSVSAPGPSFIPLPMAQPPPPEPSRRTLLVATMLIALALGGGIAFGLLGGDLPPPAPTAPAPVAPPKP